MAETLHVDGLTAPVEIIIDTHGIPHISAQTVEDAFFGQGYAAASARLWQMDIGQRRARGELAAAFGPEFAKFDEAARLMNFQGDLAAEWARYDPRVPGIARAWTAGVNARVAELRANPSLLPPEFAALGIAPLVWDPDDLVRLRGPGAANARGETRRAVLACQGALEQDALMVPLSPPWTTKVPEGLDPCLLDAKQLDILDRLAAPLPFARAVRTGETVRLPDDIDARNGSNAWVIGPTMSATGRPILANDPHLPFSVPGPRFITHLRAPGFELAGAGFPSRPGMQFGHNERIAFGRTDFQIDQQDLVVLELNDAADAYRTASGWAPVTRWTETIAVRGAAALSVPLARTAQGPIIFEDPARHYALALRAVAQLPGAAIALEFIPKTLARNWPEFRAALRYAVWGTNYMYADIDGNIGWQSAGWAPRRPHHDGLLPVPAAGDYEWAGILSLDEMPHEFNPPRGWIATANQMPFPADFPYAERKISFEWIADDRYRRIVDVLSAQTTHTIADSIALQHDTLSSRATRLVRLLADVQSTDLAPELALLRAWDQRMEPDSAAAALSAFTLARLTTVLHDRLIPEARRKLLTTIHPHVMLDALEHLPDRDAVLLAALREASHQLRSRFGDNPAAWRWGDIHALDLHHELASLLPMPSSVHTPSGGDGSTVMARWWATMAQPRASGGALFAGVFDVGNWDASLVTNAPGQSGDPRSPHYADLLPLWSSGQMFPLSPGAAESHVLLTPK